MCLLPHNQNGQTAPAALWVKNKIVDILKNWVQERVDVNTVTKLPAEYQIRNFLMDKRPSKKDFSPISPLTAR
jgi:hypothetical protein